MSCIVYEKDHIASKVRESQQKAWFTEGVIKSMWLRTASQGGGRCLCAETTGCCVHHRRWMQQELVNCSLLLAWRHKPRSEATAGAAALQGQKAVLGIDLFLLSGKRRKAQKLNTNYSGQCWNCQIN